MFTKRTPTLCLAILLLLAPAAFGQRTPVSTGWNLFTTQQDVEMGRLLARDAEVTLDLSDDTFARAYISTLGNQLASHAPGYKFPYEFKIFNDLSVQSFALPGGKIYVSSGLVSAVTNEPQLAAILAHQIGHVVARHGTRQVSTAYSNLTNTGRSNPSVTDVISRLGLKPDSGSVALKYTIQAEREADIIAAQLLYDARFDPRQITSGLRELSAQTTSQTTEFFRDHPAPRNRAAVVRRELQRLGRLSAGLRGDSADLHTAQRNLENELSARGPDPIGGDRPELPANRFVIYQGYDFEIHYPENWYADETGVSVILAPDGGNIEGSLAYGMLIDTFQPRAVDSFFGRNSFIAPGQSRSTVTTLTTATDQLIEDLRRSNPSLRVVRTTAKQIAGIAALEVEMTNDSPLGGREVNRLTTFLRPGDVLYYFLAVAPQSEINRYGPTFDRMTSSIRFF